MKTDRELRYLRDVRDSLTASLKTQYAKVEAERTKTLKEVVTKLTIACGRAQQEDFDGLKLAVDLVKEMMR